MPTTVGHSGQRIAFERLPPLARCCPCACLPAQQPTESLTRDPAHVATRPPVATGDRGRSEDDVRQ